MMLRPKLTHVLGSKLSNVRRSIDLVVRFNIERDSLLMVMACSANCPHQGQHLAHKGKVKRGGRQSITSAYLGDHIEYEVETDVGTLFIIATPADQWKIDRTVVGLCAGGAWTMRNA